MSDLQSDYDETHEELAKANQRIAELEKEIERLKRGRDKLVETQEGLIEENKRLESAVSVKDIDIKNLRAENEGMRPDAERLKWLLQTYPYASHIALIDTPYGPRLKLTRKNIDAARGAEEVRVSGVPYKVKRSDINGRSE
jgi:regulator of replication initiation timing